MFHRELVRREDVRQLFDCRGRRPKSSAGSAGEVAKAGFSHFCIFILTSSQNYKNTYEKGL
jgi:hypothetical protein